MAAYASAVTSTMQKVARLHEVIGYAVYCGQIDVTNYNSSTKPEITAISDKFKSVLAVTFDGCSDNGHVFHWDQTNKTIDAYLADYDAVADGPLIEATTDDDVGSCSFIAFGLI